VAALRAGDSRAGDVLDELYRKALVRFCWGYLGTVEQAEDAVQEIFIKVLQANQVPEGFRAWLYKIARNHCLNVLRARRRRRSGASLPSASRLDAQLTGNLTRLVRKEFESRINSLIGALPAAQREVLRLRYAEELSRAEIASVLEVPESVIKSRLYEGLKTLRKHISLLQTR
jgi:RNA polymerase sigma-70 factor (ECF subfamily)